ncbi:hypothetical protein [Microvirga sp. M2]|uniref:glucosamine inositolphosphorylceramide transferase family protein n=1 Tax=Microvirga sp. M2 TaxID=3073270 RepID=UPI0039C032FF
MRERIADVKGSNGHDHYPPSAHSKRSTARSPSLTLVRVLGLIEEAVLRASTHHRKYVSEFDISELIPFTICTTTSLSSPDLTHRFRSDDVTKIRELDLDLLIMPVGVNLSGDILKAARLGIIAVQYSDNRGGRDSPPGFWDVYHRNETSSFSFILFTKEANSGVPLRHGRCSTKFFWKYNEANIFQRSMYHLKRLVEEIAEKDSLPAALPQLPYPGPSAQYPTLPQFLRYGGNIARHIVRKVATKLMRRLGWDFRWRVAYVPTNWADAVLWRGIDIKNPPSRFLADPFVITREGKHYCFVEDFSYKTGKADIAVYELAADGATRLGTVITEPFHLSFPYLFTYNGELYMCPESASNKDIRVYRCISFPLHWRLEKIILTGVHAADTMLFEQDGRWWMLTNVDPFGTYDHGSELSIFYADSPLSTEWTAHEQNPVLIDASCARNAGLVRQGEKLYRVSQCQGFDFYGRRSRVNEIIELTSTTYVEECALTIKPDFKPKAKGTHHLHSNGSVTAFDYIAYDNFKL